MVADSSIRVTVRYRPMNRREKSEEKNGVCVKVSDCHRACEIENDTTGRKSTFFFDKVYPPGVAQSDVYTYTGRPLVDACIKGYNSTLFAYGQTGSGKTFSMMGVLGTDNRGIQPRVIEDLFDYIENDAENPEEYKISISMCEIYMERIKDLLNPKADNCQVRESKEQGIYVEGIQKAHCASATEVLDCMDRGFMNRAVSATKMNPESSRSHCVTILECTRTKANGSVSVAKIKMVDLAGSEKTGKTEATGNRLKEAMMINSSLTALSKVLNALCEGSKFIPYRDSKLTRLLQDALGGNSKTSLICAASPCAFNCEETISTLRFGERAKKVKCNAKINAKLSPDEYKKRVGELEKEVNVLTLENELFKLKEAETKKFLTAKNFSYDDIVSKVKMAGADEPSAEGMSFEAVSSQMYEVNKVTGMAVGGAAFQVSMNTKKSMMDKAAAQKAENERIAQLLFTAVSRGDYEQAGIILGSAVQLEGSMSSAAASDFENQIADLKAELRGVEEFNDQLSNELEDAHTHEDEMTHQISQLQAAIAEHRFYKQKVAFLEKENEMVMRNMKTTGPMVEEADDSEIDLSWAANMSPEQRAQIEKLTRRADRNAALVKRMKSERSLNMEDIMETLKDGNQKAAFKKILQSQMDTTAQLGEANKQNEKIKRTVTMLAEKEKHWRQLQSNWKGQLNQMEQAVILCSSIQKRDQKKYQTELRTKDEEIQRLKAYVQKIQEMPIRGTRQAERGSLAKSKLNRMSMNKRMKKRRPMKVVRRDDGERREAGVSA